ncbi:NADH dehydrogenase subunit M [Melghiribacillus thermohalophilus]|uniref:NADH dehydrogenase subunit M n=1 Tax=Melghiribacillus thermohalophilus TaxID=1324956 RepID=A0A4R3NAE3_9BACI|nr:NADH-quinone oxidoreductase subunit M [Melghiribacillus thermohalophilus]TCT26422.1 NADH dehydrogenase subunit M [Melghiribacillus thermohalophilus]
MGLLSLFVFSPIVGLVLISLLSNNSSPKIVQRYALIGGFIPLIVSWIVYFIYQRNNRLAENFSWFSYETDSRTLVIDYELELNGFRLALLLLTTLIVTLSILASVKDIKKNPKLFYQWLFILELGMLGVFASDNMFLFFFFFELTLIPMFFLIGKWGHVEREETAYKYLIYNGLGSAVLLIAIVAVFIQAGNANFEAVKDYMSTMDDQAYQIGVIVAFLVAFGVKLPIVPLHSWMVNVHVYAPPAVVMIHAGVLLKIGAYGLLQFGAGMFPETFPLLAVTLAVLGLINLLYGAFLALIQDDLRKVFAYASVSHMGIILLGIAGMNTAGYQGAIFQTISHGLISALLFYLVGVLINRTSTTNLEKLGGLWTTAPVLSGFFLAAALAGLGLPGMSGFVSEFMAFLGVFENLPVFGAIGIIGIILTAVYFLRAILNISFGKRKGKALDKMTDLRNLELLPAGVLLAFIILIGVYPDSLGQLLQITLETFVAGMGG